MKFCKDCGQTKPLSEFHPRLGKRTTFKGAQWVSAYCKKCLVIRSQKWQQKNKKRYRQYLRDYWKYNKK